MSELSSELLHLEMHERSTSCATAPSTRRAGSSATATVPKLEVSGRAEAAARAAQLGLLA